MAIDMRNAGPGSFADLARNNGGKSLLMDDGDTANVENSAGGAAHTGNVSVANAVITVKLPATTAMVDNAEIFTTTGTATTNKATVTVAGGVITGIALS